MLPLRELASELLANHAHQLLCIKPIKLVDYNRLLEEAYNLLELLTSRPELKNLLGECHTLSLDQLSEADPPFAHRAIAFINNFHYRFTKDHSIPKNVLKQLEELSKRTKLIFVNAASGSSSPRKSCNSGSNSGLQSRDTRSFN